jgi:hypothetical protein
MTLLSSVEMTPGTPASRVWLQLPLPENDNVTVTIFWMLSIMKLPEVAQTKQLPLQHRLSE